MDWEALEGTKEFEGGIKRGPNAAYCSSKLANVLFGIKLAEKLKVFPFIKSILVLPLFKCVFPIRIKE